MEIRDAAGELSWAALDNAHVAAKGRAVINTDHWTERWPDHPVIRTLDPPKAVKVDIL